MHAIEFFDDQFRRQIQAGEFVLNPFEKIALEHLRGSVLDLGCGLGNLSLEAGRRGHDVVAVDASAAAVERIATAAVAESIRVCPVQQDVSRWVFDRDFDTVVAIGLLMFFRRERALDLLRNIQAHVAPGGVAVVNVLIEGTTYMAMFGGDDHHLFGPRELDQLFEGWRIVQRNEHSFPAPGETRKVFVTIVVERPRVLSPADAS